ncbi:hypothetical protein DRN86_05445 [Candidatus Geothermarchaeota archaeon]|nr:MAG: hypothetical protein DRN86_05445 [Candidatus Geothermarchaeota archaeon]
MKEVGVFREPLYGYEQRLVIVPVDQLTVIKIQRKPSPYHIRRLVTSIRRVGFVTPLTAIKRNGKIIVIDGQHRLLAAKEAGVREVPCIIIPEVYAHNLMELNVEKQMSLREKAYVALNVYRTYLNEDSSIMEDDTRILDSIDYAYYVTLGIAYEVAERLFGSAYESLLKRVDGFLSMPLNKAIKVREKRAKIVVNIDEVAKKAVEKVKELGITHPFLYREVVSFCNPIGRKRKVSISFEELFSQLKERLEELIENPEKIREHKFSEIS